jgi:hypothetical protein
MRVFWLSFVDPDRPKGDRFLGVCVIEVSEAEAAAMRPELHERFPRHTAGAEWLAAAVRKAHRLGINPGGQIASHELPPDWPLFDAIPRHLLLSRADLQLIRASWDASFDTT